MAATPRAGGLSVGVSCAQALPFQVHVSFKEPLPVPPKRTNWLVAAS